MGAGAAVTWRRRDVLGAAGALALAGCGEAPDIVGGFVGTHPERGHALLLEGSAGAAALLAGAAPADGVARVRRENQTVDIRDAA